MESYLPRVEECTLLSRCCLKDADILFQQTFGSTTLGSIVDWLVWYITLNSWYFAVSYDYAVNLLILSFKCYDPLMFLRDANCGEIFR